MKKKSGTAWVDILVWTISGIGIVRPINGAEAGGDNNDNVRLLLYRQDMIRNSIVRQRYNVSYVFWSKCDAVKRIPCGLYLKLILTFRFFVCIIVYVFLSVFLPVWRNNLIKVFIMIYTT